AYYAAKGGNFPLARYYVKKVASLFRLCAIARPKYAAQLEAYRAHTLEPLEKAIAARDFGAFETAYTAGIAEANRLHVATGQREILGTGGADRTASKPCGACGATGKIKCTPDNCGGTGFNAYKLEEVIWKVWPDSFRKAVDRELGKKNYMKLMAERAYGGEVS